jgi:hypothetical protein
LKWVFGTAILGITAVLLLVNEWAVGGRSQTAAATVLESGVWGRSGVTIASVSYAVDGRTVEATLRAWFCRLHAGESIPILYSPSDLGNVAPDWFWQRHFGSAIALTMFGVLATAQALSFLNDRRRHSLALLRDDYVGPRSVSRGAQVLPIDTSPRLWDQQLDG